MAESNPKPCRYYAPIDMAILQNVFHRISCARINRRNRRNRRNRPCMETSQSTLLTRSCWAIMHAPACLAIRSAPRSSDASASSDSDVGRSNSDVAATAQRQFYPCHCCRCDALVAGDVDRRNQAWCEMPRWLSRWLLPAPGRPQALDSLHAGGWLVHVDSR
jgi:hypothetical protein